MPATAAISTDQADRLFWLGRYVERVYSTLRVFNQAIDRMLDHDESSYIEFCRRLSIPCCYEGPEDFVRRYLFDALNPDSIASSLSHAYDNAIVMRNFITTETMAYIQLALDSLEAGAAAESSFLETQRVSDFLLAFWGSVDDRVASLARRDLLKTGKYAERLDLMIRLDLPEYRLDALTRRLLSHTKSIRPLLNEAALKALEAEADALGMPGVKPNRQKLLAIVNELH